MSKKHNDKFIERVVPSFKETDVTVGLLSDYEIPPGKVDSCEYCKYLKRVTHTARYTGYITFNIYCTLADDELIDSEILASPPDSQLYPNWCPKKKQ